MMLTCGQGLRLLLLLSTATAAVDELVLAAAADADFCGRTAGVAPPYFLRFCDRRTRRRAMPEAMCAAMGRPMKSGSVMGVW